MSKSNEARKSIRIDDGLRKFAKIDISSYKKKMKKDGVYFDSKKEVKHGYYAYILDSLPASIDFLCKYGYLVQDEGVQAIKTGVYSKIVDPDFIKYLMKEIKDGNKFKNMKLLPILISEILHDAARVNTERRAEDPNASTYDMTDIVKLSELILKSKIKKFEKASVSRSLAFDLLSVIPCDKAFEYSYKFKLKTFFDVLYEHSKGESIEFEKIVDLCIPSEWEGSVLVFALLERKEKFSKLTDAQKALYLSISNWCFDTLEKLPKTEIKKILNIYINSRRRDDVQGRDGNRRYQLSSLSPNDYKKIAEVINILIAENDTNKKYL